MPTLCGEITDDIELNCDERPTGGVKQVLTLINLNDIESVVYDTANPLIVREINLKAGKKAYKYEVFKRGHRPRFEQVNGEYGNNFRHVVDTSIQAWNNAVKAQFMGLVTGSVVAIAENLQAGGDARVEIYGLTQGLSVADGAVRNLAENEGVLAFTLQSEDGALEPKIPNSFAVEDGDPAAYDYTATIAALNALYTPAV